MTAAQAFEDLSEDHKRFVPTNLDALDAALAAGVLGQTGQDVCPGGVQKGQVTEIWGPPGVGKSTFGQVLCCQIPSFAY